jgi:hypothetical protein
MSYRWPNKDPQDTLDYTIDWSRFLPSGVTLSAAQWYVEGADKVKQSISAGATVAGITLVAVSASTTTTTIVLMNGTNNVDYKFTCHATFSNGNIVERSVRLSVKEN